MTTYKRSDIQAIFNISHETVRTWARVFGDWLSPTARPEQGRQRVYTSEDLRVFSLISELREKGRGFDAIAAALGAGQRGELPDIPPEQAALAIQKTVEVERALLRIEQLEDDLADALERVKELEVENIRLQEKASDNSRLQAEVRDLYQQIGRLTLRLEMEREKRTDSSNAE